MLQPANSIRSFFPSATALKAVVRICLLLSLACTAQAADYELLANFLQPGALPHAAPILHANGNAYGTTLSGGAFDMGTLYKLAPDGALQILHSFNGSDGQSPVAGLTLGPDGHFYGSTEEGGANGFGTLFKINPSGTFTHLISFTGTAGAAPGSVPAGLTTHPNGDLYGLTQAGGSNNKGTIFRLSPNGQITSLLHFTGTAGAAPGAQPVASLTLVGSDLYGLTRSGGANDDGTLFRISPSGAYTALGAFSGISGNQTGRAPRAPLLAHSDGKLYGSTEFGGANDQGVLFRVSTNGSGYSVLHTFDDLTGSKPSGALAEASDASIWGTTATGGNNGLGTLFSITPNGALSARAHFSGTSGAVPGSSPLGGLSPNAGGGFIGTASDGGPGNNGLIFAIDNAGNYSVRQRFTTDLGWAPSGAPSLSAQGELIYPLALGGSSGSGTIAQILDTGSTQLKATLSEEIGSIPVGGFSSDNPLTIGITTKQGGTGRGGAFQVDAAGLATSLSSFTSTAGEVFSGPLLKKGTDFYGVSQAGGLANKGTLFKIAADGTLSRVFSFSGTNGSRKGNQALAPLVLHPDGAIYGVTQRGGASDLGTLFKLAADGTFTTLVEFDANGPQLPSTGLTLGNDGKLYGGSAAGGSSDLGTLFSFDPSNNTLSTEASFDHSGHAPVGLLSLGSDDALYGIASQGGNGFGAAFRYRAGSPIEILSTFTGTSGSAPGIPTRSVATGVEVYGGLALASDGKIYGTLPAGGPTGGGILFRLNPLTPLQQWMRDNLGDINAPETDDPDKDGLPTLLEYALGSQPQTSDNPDVLAFEIDQSNNSKRLSLSFQREANRPDIKIFVEASTSPLGPWSPIASSEFGSLFAGDAAIEETLLGDNRIQTRIIHTPLLQQAKTSFLRIRVTH